MALSYKIHSSSALEPRLYTLLPILALVYSYVGPDELFFLRETCLHASHVLISPCYCFQFAVV